MKRFALLGFLAVALCALLVTRPALADDTWVIHRGPILDQALADQRAGRSDLALQRLRYLLRSSPDAADESYLLALQDQIRRESPWIVNGGGSFLPSTNIDSLER